MAALLESAAQVPVALLACTDQLTDAAQLLADRLRAGGRVLFLGAGTSGRLAVGEAAELPGTFGLAPDRVLGRCAGDDRPDVVSTGRPADADEDDGPAGRRAVAAARLGGADVLVAVAASGRTPYTVAAAEAARTNSVAVIAVVNAAGSPLAVLADVAVTVVVGPEVLRGSTRTNAGTAQKVALNTVTTAAAVLLGRVHGDLMVDVVAANAKLRERAAGIVAEIAGTDPATATAALDACGWNARAAVLHLALGLDPTAARERAAAHRTLREALIATG